MPCRLGDFIELVESRIKKKGKVRIFEAGYGCGAAMTGFIKKFGDKIEILNRKNLLIKNHEKTHPKIEDRIKKIQEHK